MIVDSKLARALRSGGFVVTAEVGPPRGADPEAIRRKARLLKGQVTAANVTDNQSAVARLSSLAACVLALQEGLEPVLQVTCRDRNRLAITSDLLGASALGIRNVLALTGDHVSFGNHPEAKPVYDLDTYQLIQMTRRLTDEGRFLSGEEARGAPELLVGATDNPFTDPFGGPTFRLAKKVRAGAEFVQTQLVYNLPRFAEWMAAVRERGLHERVKILAGVGPLKTVRRARHMKAHVPGMDIPDEMIDRLAKVPAKEARRESLRMCVETIQRLREIPGLAGVHLMAIDWEEVVPEIVESAGIRPGPDLL